MTIQPEQLRKFILDSGVIKKEDFLKAEKKAKKTGKPVEEALLSEELISQEQLTKLQAYILGIPFVNLENDIIPPEILKIVPESIARVHNIIAFRKTEDNIEVAMLDPEDLRTIEFIKRKANLKILPRLTTSDSIKSALRQYQRTLEAEFGEIIKKEADNVYHTETEELDGLKKSAEDIPIVRIVDTLIKHAILQRASDIHIEPTEKEVVVRYRIDGILRDAMILPKNINSGIVARIKVLSNLKIDESRLPQDGRFKIETDEYKYSARVSILPIFDGEKIVMRLLSETTKSLSLEELGFRGESLEDVQTSLRKPVGMILITGPTGSGKTTTLYTMMEILNTPEVNISTVEDPIEYRMPRINQTQVNPKIGLTFASGLRSLLRQDPDIIMVGEIRDAETAGLAINAALTGHLVLSTLHTNDAAGAVPRLIDMGAEAFLVSSTLNLIIAQRLIRKLSSEKEKYRLNESEIKELGKYCDIGKILEILKKEKIASFSDKIENVEFYRPKNHETGYAGRIGIYEVMKVTETIKDMVVKKATADDIEKQAKQEGMRTMIEDGFIKAAQGLTSVEEVLRVIME